MSLPKRLKQLRIELNLTQKQLSEIMDVPKQRVADIETGKVKNLRGIELCALQDLYNINPIWLTYGRGEMFIQPNFNFSKDVMEIAEILNKYAPPQLIEEIKKDIIKKIEDHQKQS
ncbi:MAG: helix-turn-helix transcriptional regulator [Sulfurovaceae bacterium]|nr:helix-turn-helix transcriptional regulator [Sulfurovaceae bacterium]